MNLRLALASAAGVLALTTPATAVSPNVGLASGQFTIGISGFVPVICRTSLDASMVAPTAGTVQLGSLREFCNSPNGYRVHADYSPELARARLLVDGRPVPLGRGGTSVVSHSNRAAIDSHSLALDLPQGVSGGSISFRIEPL